MSVIDPNGEAATPLIFAIGDPASLPASKNSMKKHIAHSFDNTHVFSLSTQSSGAGRTAAAAGPGGLVSLLLLAAAVARLAAQRQ